MDIFEISTTASFFTHCIVLIFLAVRYGRVPKRSRSQDEQKVTTTVDSQDMSNPESSQESLQLAMYDIILTVSQAHHANCSTTDDKLKQLVRQPTSLVFIYLMFF